MSKWLSIGVAPEQVYQDWKLSHESNNKRLKKQLELETKKEGDEARKGTLMQKRYTLTNRRLFLLDNGLFDAAEASKLWGVSLRAAREILGGMIVAGRVEKIDNHYRKVK